MLIELYILIIAVSLYMLISVTFIYFSAIMHFKHLKSSLTKPQKLLIYPHLLIGYLLDVLVNLIIGTFLFRELPKEWLFSDRLTRHKITHAGQWQGRRAVWWGENVLDNIDPSGKHI